MSYTVLARKYRPQTFEELVGQEHVARTLAGAIRADRVAHAFLFTGVRGVGKTSTARLLAKALCCEAGPTPTPCNACDTCRDITRGADVDVQEIDGASNNSVDDVRRLQESLPYRPSRNRYKIVIVDEVHMLSTGAVNALLKTLEEPPEHVKFIFATTESHKVPVTIRSRCQRYDFRLIPHAVISARVRHILQAEAIEADDEAVAIVAREAAGSMRDALTLLDQLVAFAGSSLVGDVVSQTLGIAARKHVLDAGTALLTGDGASALRAVEGLAEQGVDMLHFAKQLLELSRDLVILSLGEDLGDLVGLVADEQAQASAILEGIDTLEVQRAFTALSRVVEDVGRSAHPRTTLEMGLVRIATRPALHSVAELLARLDALQAGQPRGGGSQGGGAGGGTRGGSSSGGQGRNDSGGGTSRMRAGAAPREPLSASAPRRGSSQGPRSWAVRAPIVDSEKEDECTTASIPEGDAPNPFAAAASHAADSAQSPTAPSAPKTEEDASRLESRAQGRMPSPPQASTDAGGQPLSSPPPEPKAEIAEPKAALVEPEQATSFDLPSDPMERWEKIIGHLSNLNPAVAAILEHAEPREVTGEHILLAFPESSFYATQAESPSAQEALLNTARAVLGSSPVLSIVRDAAADTSSGTVAALKEERLGAAREQRRQDALEHPLIVEALQLFPVGANHVEVNIDME